MSWLPGSGDRRDVALAVGVAGLAQAEVWSGIVEGGPEPAVAATALVMGLVLAWRRQAPLTVAVVVCTAGVALAVLGVDSNTFFTPVLAMVVAVSSAAYHCRRPLLALFAALGLTWLAVLVEHGPTTDVLFAGVLVGGTWLAGYLVRIRQDRAELLEQRAGHLEREMQWQAAAAVAEEKTRIARELHDAVAHSVSVMTLHVAGVRRLLKPDQQSEREALLVVERTGREAVEEMHRLLEVLRQPAETRPYTDSARLAQAADLLEPLRAGGLIAELRVTGTPRPLPPGLDLSAYRILQEAVTNVLKHADASRIDCTIGYHDGAICVAVVDDGRTRRSDPPQPGGRHGLIGMRERVAVYGGTLETGPLPERGYRVTATLPFPREDP